MNYSQNLIIDLIDNKNYIITDEGKLFNNKGVEIKGSLNQDGYLKFSQRGSNGKTYPILIHRLQGYKKFGMLLFEKGIMIRHLDGNRLNNNINNLALGTSRDNQLDVPLEIRRSKDRNKYDSELILSDYKKGMTYREIAVKHNVKHRRYVYDIIKTKLKIEY